MVLTCSLPLPNSLVGFGSRTMVLLLMMLKTDVRGIVPRGPLPLRDLESLWSPGCWNMWSGQNYLVIGFEKMLRKAIAFADSIPPHFPSSTGRRKRYPASPRRATLMLLNRRDDRFEAIGWLVTFFKTSIYDVLLPFLDFLFLSDSLSI